MFKMHDAKTTYLKPNSFFGSAKNIEIEEKTLKLWKPWKRLNKHKLSILNIQCIS